MKVVVDINVLVSGIFWTGKPGKVVDYWLDKKIQLNVSEDILREYKRVITKIANTLHSPEIADHWMSLIVQDANIIDAAQEIRQPVDIPHRRSRALSGVQNWCVQI